MAIKPGKDREKSERQKNGEKLDGARSMMKTNFSQKRVEKNGKSAEKSFFLRRKPLLLVDQKGSNPRPSPKDPKHAVFSQKERNRGQKAPICGQAYPDLTEKQRRPPRRKRKKRAFQNFLFGFCQSVQLSQPADVVSGLEAIRGPGNPRISKLFRQVGGGEGSRTPVLRRHSGNVYIHVLPLKLIVAPRAGKRASLRLSRLKSRSTAAGEP